MSRTFGTRRPRIQVLLLSLADSLACLLRIPEEGFGEDFKESWKDFGAGGRILKVGDGCKGTGSGIDEGRH